MTDWLVSLGVGVLAFAGVVAAYALGRWGR